MGLLGFLVWLFYRGCVASPLATRLGFAKPGASRKPYWLLVQSLGDFTAGRSTGMPMPLVARPNSGLCARISQDRFPRRCVGTLDAASRTAAPARPVRFVCGIIARIPQCFQAGTGHGVGSFLIEAARPLAFR